MSSNSRSVNELKTELAAVEGKVKDANAQLAAAMQGLKAAEEKRQEALDKKDQFAIDQALLSINVANKAINTALHLVEKWGERLGKLLDDLSQAEKAAFGGLRISHRLATFGVHRRFAPRVLSTEDKRKESKKVGGEQKSTTGHPFAAACLFDVLRACSTSFWLIFRVAAGDDSEAEEASGTQHACTCLLS